MSIVGVSGSLSNPSRTTALIETVSIKIEAALQADSHLIRVADFGTTLGGISNPKTLPAEVAQAYSSLRDASIIVVGTPVYKASYTGLLKHFFDLLAPRDLNGKIVVRTATGGSDHHALVIEHQLRPLLGFFSAVTVPTGIYAKDSDFSKDEAGGTYSLSNTDIAQRVETAAAQAVQLYRAFH